MFFWSVVAKHKATTLQVYVTKKCVKYRFRPNKQSGQAVPCQVPIGSPYGAPTKKKGSVSRAFSYISIGFLITGDLSPGSFTEPL